MSHFSELLSRAIDESGMTIKYLSECSGFEASHITRFKNGSRKPNNQVKLEALIDALQVARSDREALMDAYYVDHIGEEKYKEYEAVISLIESADQLPTVSVFSSYQHDLSNILVIQSYHHVINIMTKVMEQACSEKEDAIYVMAQPDSNAVVELLLQIEMNDPEIGIHHVLYLRPAQKGAENVSYNLECAQRILLLMRNGRHYHPSYYYEKYPMPRDNGLLFPNLIITNRYAMTISADYQNALLYDDPRIVSFYQELFLKQESTCKPFGITYASLMDTLHLYKSFHTPFDTKNDQRHTIVLTYQPCVLKYVRKEDQYAVKEGVEQGQIIDYFFAEYQQGIKRLNIYDCFTVEGLYEFLNTGVIVFIREFMEPFSLPLRKRLIGDLLAAAKKGDHLMRIVKPNFINIPMSLTAYCANDQRVLIELSYFHDTLTSLSFSESSINNALADFLRFVPDSHWVYSQEESIQIVQNMLDEMIH